MFYRWPAKPKKTSRKVAIFVSGLSDDHVKKGKKFFPPFLQNVRKNFKKIERCFFFICKEAPLQKFVSVFSHMKVKSFDQLSFSNSLSSLMFLFNDTRDQG
jgi:hypothetical protein